jgi:hypothetical protein
VYAAVEKWATGAAAWCRCGRSKARPVVGRHLVSLTREDGAARQTAQHLYHSGNREIARSSDNDIRHGPATRAPADQFVVLRPVAGRFLLAVERREARCDIAQEVRLALQSYR